MAKKKDKTKKTAVENQSQWTEVRHQVAVLMEDMDSKFNMVIEKVQGSEERLIRRMDERFAIQNQRFDLVETVLKQHSQKFQILENKMDNMEHRMGNLEQKIDKVIEKVEDHDKDIKELKIVAAH